MFGQPSSASYKEITPAEAQAKLEKGEAVLIDVREPAEYQQVHAKGAKLMPLGTVQQHLSELPTDKDVLMICKSGGRSSQACMIAGAAGQKRLYNVSGGTTAWLNAGLPNESGH